MIYLIKQGHLHANGVSSVWQDYMDEYFKSHYEAEKYLANKDYERDHDNIYFKFDENYDETIIAKITNLKEIESH